jgi:hypothetical protein
VSLESFKIESTVLPFLFRLDPSFDGFSLHESMDQLMHLARICLVEYSNRWGTFDRELLEAEVFFVFFVFFVIVWFIVSRMM